MIDEEDVVITDQELDAEMNPPEGNEYDGPNAMQKMIYEELDQLLGENTLRDVAEQGLINNKMRYAMMRLMNDNLKEISMSSEMLGQWRQMMKDIDGTIFKIAQLSNDDRSLDNDEMIAKALSEVTRQIVKDPYCVDVPSDDETQSIIKPPLIQDEFDFVPGSDLVGLDPLNYDEFSKHYQRSGGGPEKDEDEDSSDDDTADEFDLERTVPLPGKLYG